MNWVADEEMLRPVGDLCSLESLLYVSFIALLWFSTVGWLT